MGGYYPDFQSYLEHLDRQGLLQRIRRPINKDTEMHPLVRIQFRGLPESARKGFLFEQVIDSRGKKYDIPVAVGCIAASKQVYLEGMQCRDEEELTRCWTRAQVEPIPAVLVSEGLAQEVVHQGKDLSLPGGGMDMIPVPVSTPGLDNAPYITAGHWITKDPETGIRNVGNYRGMIKSTNRIGCYAGSSKGLTDHWLKCRKQGIPLQVAIAIGVTPNVACTAIAKLPMDVDELAVAGGLAGEPLEVVRCKTVDLEVPAHTEIVIEGVICTDALEHEAPFGEFTGYMGLKELMYYMDVTCITHRRNPTYMAFLSQFPPSESSKIRQITWERILYKYLAVDEGIKGVKEVALHEPTGSWGLCVIRLAKQKEDDAWSALQGVARRTTVGCKMVVAVDEDVDCRDPDAVNWALSFHMQPYRDLQVVDCEKPMLLDYSTAPPGQGVMRGPAAEQEPRSTCLLLDATRKWAYPPVSLPRREFMERALEIWREEGLPEPDLKEPWFGYPLGCWNQEDEEEARLAVKGEHYITGEKMRQSRHPLGQGEVPKGSADSG